MPLLYFLHIFLSEWITARLQNVLPVYTQLSGQALCPGDQSAHAEAN